MKTTAIGLLLFAALHSPVLAFAETIRLKSGETLEAEIVEKTEAGITVDLEGVSLTYFWDDILSLDGDAVPPSNGKSEDPKEVAPAALTHPAHGDPGPFGVLEFLSWDHDWNHHKYPDSETLKKAVALMKEARVGWVRMDFLWEDIEPEKGRFAFEKYDAIVDLLTENNIGVLGLLSYNASWTGSPWNAPPGNDKDFVGYAGAVIARYKDKVKHWEIWNEPDDAQYWTPQDDMVAYTQLLKKVYRRAKEIDPDCKILNGGLSKTVTLSLRRIYKNGGKGYFDILAIHPFVNPLNEVDVARVKGLYKGCRQIMQDNGDDKKIWFTELGAPGVGSPSSSNSWWLGTSPTEEQQAAWVERIYTEILPELPDCERVFWAFFRDCQDHWRNGIDYFGLVRWDFSKKPAFDAYKESVRRWDGAPPSPRSAGKASGTPWHEATSGGNP